jgi:signal transduction histidine kinase
MRRWRPWPRSLAARTMLVLLLGLACVQGAGLLIHALDRVQLQRLAEARDLGRRLVALYQTVVSAPPEQWPRSVEGLDAGPDIRASIGLVSPRGELDPAPARIQQIIRPFLRFGALPLALRPHGIAIRGSFAQRWIVVGFHLPDERWLDFRVAVPPLRPWHSPNFLVAFGLMTAAAAGLTLWAVRRLTAPVRDLAAAAERLGRDVNAPALPENGPAEVASAAVAFNTMAARIRRFVEDRTFLLTALGHDLRTPITRLKLRAEWMQDEDQRRKMLADLDELEGMVAATLAFGRDAAGNEPLVALDLAVLLRTVLDEAAEARPALAERLAYAGPEHLVVQARSVALKRAFSNLVGNALAYGGDARVVLVPPRDGLKGRPKGEIVVVHVEDSGPGLPPDQVECVFEPFRRLETSRNRETGGTGLGLPIARNILRAHGGDITLANRPEGGLAATVMLPA